MTLILTVEMLTLNQSSVGSNPTASTISFRKGHVMIYVIIGLMCISFPLSVYSAAFLFYARFMNRLANKDFAYAAMIIAWLIKATVVMLIIFGNVV